ncbi:SGNH/GDSL hydrolase family protein [Chitinophaga tropicalis]|uniref:Esterase n=1 Tax=Chitinophaga tropicalis TaxID=2683588 RepID=A0A7K1U4I1_9BACT|nr:SGNH/GDSL hydrolase family protein [Chitinophaga tropicalis]MVT09250.1 esterase [Chitinophaga tropicalis]
MERRTFLQTGLLAASFSLEHKYLRYRREEAPFIVNAGTGGNNTADLLARMEKDCLSHKPDLTILMIGTNDMNSRKHIPLPQYEKNLRQIVSAIRKTGSRLLMITILPGYEPYLYTRHPQAFYAPEGYQARNKAVNDVIRKIADAEKQPLLDMHHVFEAVGNIGVAPDSLLQNEANSGKTDGIHPTPEGYRLMATVIYDCIIQRELPHKRVVCFGDSITFGDGGLEGRSYPAYLKKLFAY